MVSSTAGADSCEYAGFVSNTGLIPKRNSLYPFSTVWPKKNSLFGKTELSDNIGCALGRSFGKDSGAKATHCFLIQHPTYVGMLDEKTNTTNRFQRKRRLEARS
mmetsp:Transcript_54302/g.63462  ORF Transcript_54302/g.63462 Transcript_54302/m.63462 type:complete len:104 (-) Transcript_54302:266-577(-)